MRIEKTLQERFEEIISKGIRWNMYSGTIIYQDAIKQCAELCENLLAEQQTQMNEVAKERALEFAQWISDNDLKEYGDGWCQSGGSNGYHQSLLGLYSEFLKQRQEK